VFGQENFGISLEGCCQTSGLAVAVAEQLPFPPTAAALWSAPTISPPSARRRWLAIAGCSVTMARQ
jgi:hypothetical protein